ncbi:hypothetical protein BP00DRAFT_215610 [Aspergillus indologenus CBS 114.80]|uniref:Uncharacterized protein n=1 Tax=Aspergillus indologenus CBS 114.80 TaxID=1450541 RepID=A0A2V5I773_9EURO|nr:hypothetical protein BP00DRAFT_215610 [Aspergillus indologenus CBS 114.80]
MSIRLHLPCLCTHPPPWSIRCPPIRPRKFSARLVYNEAQIPPVPFIPIFLILLAPFFFSPLLFSSIISSILSILVKNSMLLVHPYVVLLAVIRGSRSVALFLAASNFLNPRKLAYRVSFLSCTGCRLLWGERVEKSLRSTNLLWSNRTSTPFGSRSTRGI